MQKSFGYKNWTQLYLVSLEVLTLLRCLCIASSLFSFGNKRRENGKCHEKKWCEPLWGNSLGLINRNWWWGCRGMTPGFSSWRVGENSSFSRTTCEDNCARCMQSKWNASDIKVCLSALSSSFSCWISIRDMQRRVAINQGKPQTPKTSIDFSVGLLFVILWWVRVAEADTSGAATVSKYSPMSAFPTNYKV